MNQQAIEIDLDTLLKVCRAASDGDAAATAVWVTAQFDALHYWPEAPDNVAFLRCPHRHVFHVKVSVMVEHDNRDVEFFKLKGDLQAVLSQFVGTTSTLSCEQWCHVIRGQLCFTFGYSHVLEVEVSEDGENGAVVFFDECDQSVE